MAMDSPSHWFPIDKELKLLAESPCLFCILRRNSKTENSWRIVVSKVSPTKPQRKKNRTE